MRKRRIILAAFLLALLVGVVVVVWEVNDWSPPRLILKYGFPPTGGPTGNVKTVEGIEFVELKPGYFRMGSHFACEKGNLLGRISSVFGLTLGTPPVHDSNEAPTRWVEITTRIWIAKAQVTNRQVERFVPHRWDGEDERPADLAPALFRRSGALAFCEWLAETSGVPVRLPSEAEWEYACRAGTSTSYSFGDAPERLPEYAWFADNSEWNYNEVMTRLPNAWGLFDCHGNGMEWCQDAWHDSYENAPSDGAAWTADGRVMLGSRFYVGRGGGSYDAASMCRSSYRFPAGEAGEGNSQLAVRPVFTLPEDE